MQLLTTTEAAKQLGLHPETVRRFLREGVLHGVKIGRAHRIQDAEITAYIERLPSNVVGTTNQPSSTDEAQALENIIALGARLTTHAAPLRDDAVSRSYERDADDEGEMRRSA